MHSAVLKKTIVFLLAGGVGERLYPLTRDRSKPAVPFGGIYRIIDFSLSNCLNSDLSKIIVLTQYKSLSLDRHIKMAWNLYPRDLNFYVDVVPPQKRFNDHWYNGTADAIFQNIYILEMEKPEYVIILSGDHVYKMDYRKMIEFHIDQNADLTIAAIETKKEEAARFGVISIDEKGRVTDFAEKPEDPSTVPGKEDVSYVSMGIYVFSTEKLVQYLCEDYKMEGANDFGKDIIPRAYPTERVFAYDYTENEGERAYWQDIGTIGSYFNSNMDLISDISKLNLYEKEWPIRTFMEQQAPVKMLGNECNGRCTVTDSLLSHGTVIHGSRVSNCVISPSVKIERNCNVEKSIIMHDVQIGTKCKIINTIIDKENNIPEGEVIGHYIEKDQQRFKVSPEGIVIIPKKFSF